MKTTTIGASCAVDADGHITFERVEAERETLELVDYWAAKRLTEADVDALAERYTEGRVRR